MNTPTHLLMTVAAGQASGRRIPRWSLAAGSIAPDLPLYFMTLGGAWYFQRVLGWDAQRTFRHMFDDLYFNDPMWRAFHNLLHAPLVSLSLLLILCIIRRSTDAGQATAWWIYFFSACLLHSAVDVLTHHDDGPLLLFPFEWSVRFISPISYWDHRYYGSQFMLFESLLVLGLIGYLLGRWISQRKEKN